MINMSNPSHIKDLDLVYKRWEMASFGNNPARASQDKSAQPVLNAVPVYTPPPEPIRSEDKAHFASMMAKFGEALERADEKIAHEVLSLAADIAQAMLSVKLNISEQAVLPIVKEAIGRLPHQTEGMKLKVNPEDVRLLNEHLADEIAKHHWQVIGT